jgi:hypothetical protein
MSILHAQTASLDERFRRTDVFWRNAFVPLLIMPNIINIPHTKNKRMFGCVAEQDIPANTVLMTAKGFWWPRCFAPPTAAQLGTNHFDNKNRCAIWGINAEEAGNENMLYMVNASSPLSLVNDYRGLAECPNAALVRGAVVRSICVFTVFCISLT